jgi:RNA methyltransferase, TrmH family
MTEGARVPPARIASRDNPLVKQLRRLDEHATAYRKIGQYWIEGDHLCDCAVARGLRPAVLVMSESFATRVPPAWADAALRSVLLPDRLFASISGLDSPAGVGFLVDLPAAEAPIGGVPTVVLDRVQDAGNVGSILRSAAAFGFRQVLALQGTAALWSPKVLRAGMGAHFHLRLVEALEGDAVRRTGLPLVATSSHQGAELRQLVLPRPCAWIFGHEGQGVAADLLARADVLARIAQPGGEESLNVAAAAAICLYASALSGAA